MTDWATGDKRPQGPLSAQKLVCKTLAPPTELNATSIVQLWGSGQVMGSKVDQDQARIKIAGFSPSLSLSLFLRLACSTLTDCTLETIGQARLPEPVHEPMQL